VRRDERHKYLYLFLTIPISFNSFSAFIRVSVFIFLSKSNLSAKLIKFKIPVFQFVIDICFKPDFIGKDGKNKTNKKN